MEEDPYDTDDPFSSFIITPNFDSISQIENCNLANTTQKEDTLSTKDLTAPKKLKTLRKNKEIMESSSMNAVRYKVKLKYGGQFKPIKNGKKKYCYGKQKTIYFDEATYDFPELLDDVSRLYSEDENVKLCYLDTRVSTQAFVQLDDEESYILMLQMHKIKKEVVIYVTIEKDMDREENDRVREDGGVEADVGAGENDNYEELSDYCHSEESYHSYHGDSEKEIDDADNLHYEGEFFLYEKDNPKMEVGSQFPHVQAFRGALNHYAVTNDFEYELGKSEPTRVTAICSDPECKWRIHATVSEDEVTFVIRTLQPKHTCFGGNKRGNKHATQGWVADKVIDDLIKEGDIAPIVLKQRLEAKFGVQIPYQRVWQRKELAVAEIYGDWKDSLTQAGSLREELIKRNPGSVVELNTEPSTGNSRHFQRFFVCLEACKTGFLEGCRPYISLDACHLKAKWKGVIAAATAVDGNNWMFPVAYAVMEGENEESWEWFLRLLQKAIGMPEGLVISSDMQKGLKNAIENVYPLAEHRECMRHLFSNFKKHFSGDLFKFGLWGAARTYSPSTFDALIAEIETNCPAATKYLDKEHKKLWSRSKFGTIAKCDYLTNNIAEVFNNWISEERHKPVIDLIDGIRQKIMVRFNERRRIVRSWKGSLVPKVSDDLKLISRRLIGYDVHKSMDFSAEVQKNGMRWEVNLQQQMCTCRAWQVKGIPCVHAAAFITSKIRNARWENYVDSYFTVTRLKTAYANGIAPMPSKDKWIKYELDYKMLPPILKRPVGRPKKKRFKPVDEMKRKSHKCTRCGLRGHHRSTCKNPVPTQESENGSTVQMTQGQRTKRGEKAGTNKSKKRACPTTIFKILQQEKI